MIFQVTKKKKLLAPEDVALEVSLFQSADTANRKDRIRAQRNYILYAPTDDWETWDSTSAEVLRSEGRTPNYYNFLQMYVEGNAGNFVLNKVDPEFVDRGDDNKQVQDALYALKGSFYSDKEHFDYSANHLSAVVNGCIAIGCEEVKIIRTINEPRGRIAFKSLPSISVIFDPNNLTDNIAGGSRDAWKRFYLTPRQMVDYFEDCTDDVRMRLRALAKDRPEYESRGTEFPIEKYWGGQYEVVEHYHIEKEYRHIAFDSRNMVRLPDSPHEFGSEDDWNFKDNWAKAQGFLLDPNAIQEIKVPSEALWVTTFCPDLGITFENRKDERQIIDRDGKAKLPFFTWSYITKNGKWTSLVDLGKNLQNDINLREQHKSKMFTKTPIGGKTYAHPMAFGDNDQKKQEFIRDFTDPSIPAFFDQDAPPNLRLIWNESGSQLNPAIMMDENQKMSMMDRILRLPLAMQGVSKSGGSGVLFGRQVIEGNIMQKVPSTTLEQYQNEKYTAWLSLAINLYAGKNRQEKEYNYNREFFQGKNKIVLNEFVGIDENGNDIVNNDLSVLTNVDVIISQSKDNDYMKQAKREVDIAYLQAMMPSPTNAGFRAIAEADLALNMDGLTPEQERDVLEMSKLVVEISKKSLMVQNMALDQQLNPQPMPQPGVPGMPSMPQPQGGGAPVQSNDPRVNDPRAELLKA